MFSDRELWVLAIAGDNPDRHVPLRPEVKYVANMHGNEVRLKSLHIYTGFCIHRDSCTL